MKIRSTVAAAVLLVACSLAGYAGASNAGGPTATDESLGNLHMYSVPIRNYDSRPGSGVLGAGSGPVATTVRRVAVRLPTTAVAAELNLTATNTSAGGWMRAFNIGQAPEHSNLNWSSAGMSVANQITVGVSKAGVAQAGCTTSCLFEFNVETVGSADVVIDVVGYYNASA